MSGKTNKNERADIAILGAGASGMMAAISAAEAYRKENSGAKKRILLVEHREKPGKKLYATGNGRCNFTNEDMEETYFRGDGALLHSVLKQFGKEDTLSFFRDIGVFPKEKNGYYYPASMTAASVVAALERQLRVLEVQIRTDTEVFSLDRISKRGDFVWRIETPAGSVQAKRLIVATGLLASPKLGSDGSAMDLIKGLGHRFTPVVPALCGFYAKGMDFKRAAGVRTEAGITLYEDKEAAAGDRGELQVTDYGISGIPVFQISRFASMALRANKEVEAELDLFPGMEEEALEKELERRLMRKQGIGGLLNEKLFSSLCMQMGIDKKTDCDDVKAKDAGKLAHAVKHCRVKLIKPKGFEQAQICAGGIRSEEIRKDTLESELCRGLYFCGEILNVDGICGGYNLQWAWSSGYVAGRSAAESLYERIRNGI